MQDYIGIIFDFDDTLAPDTTSAYLAAHGIDEHDFWRVRVDALLAEGWDPIPAYLYMMIQVSQALPKGQRLTRDGLANCGRQVSLYSGATRIFPLLRQHVEAVNPNIGVEFYMISSGIREILVNTRIAKQFNDIWACDFHYNEVGEIAFPKNVMSFTDKTRYIFQISKGQVGEEYSGRPFVANLSLRGQEPRIPFKQMIYVGDGYTDIPCFSLIKRYGGVALGVYNPDDRGKWGRAWSFVEDRRVSNLLPADYRKGSALRQSLLMATENIAGKITRRQQGHKE